MKIDRVTPVEDSWHECWKYKDSIKTVYCKLCASKEKRDKLKLAKSLDSTFKG